MELMIDRNVKHIDDSSSNDSSFSPRLSGSEEEGGEEEILRDSFHHYLDEEASFVELTDEESSKSRLEDDSNLAFFASPPRALTPKGGARSVNNKFISHSASKVHSMKKGSSSESSGRRFSLNKSANWFNSLSRRNNKDNRPSKNKKSLTSMFDESLLADKNSRSSPKLNRSDWDLEKKIGFAEDMSPASLVNDENRRPLRLLDVPSPEREEGGGRRAPKNNFRRRTRSPGLLAHSTSAIDSDYSTLNLTDLARKSSESCEDFRDGPGNLIRSPQAYYTIDTKRLASRHKKSARDKKLLYGIKQFNLEPKRGIAYLTESEFLEKENPKAVASFLYREGRLSKKQIGQFLGERHDFNQSVLKEFVKCHEFTHLILVQALRQFLWSFRLPGEAMQIDRVMEAFAEHYCQQNPNLFDEVDTCYILSFSIIMLNTALHNPNIRHKITLEQFLKQNRGINSGKDLPPDILELIYRNIKEEPFKIPKETYDDLMYTFFSPEKEGWLLKQGGSWKNWKRRWFVLSDRCLYYFQHTAENVPKGIIPLENVKVRSIDDKDGKLYCFELYSESNSVVKGCKTDSKGTVVQGNHRVYRMSASSAEDRKFWVQCIRDSIKEHPFYDIIATKKLALRRKSAKSGAPPKPPSQSIATSTTTLNAQNSERGRPCIVLQSHKEEESNGLKDDEDKSELETITSVETESEKSREEESFDKE